MSFGWWVGGRRGREWVGLPMPSPHPKLQVYCYHCRLKEFTTFIIRELASTFRLCLCLLSGHREKLKRNQMVSARIEPMVELIHCSHRTVYTPGESIITVTGGSKRPGTIHVLYSEHKQHKSTFHSISQYTAARSSGVVFITAFGFL